MVDPALRMTVQRHCESVLSNRTLSCNGKKNSIICKKVYTWERCLLIIHLGGQVVAEADGDNYFFFSPQSGGMGQKMPARDVKSDTDSKSAAPALLCEASCGGLILSESMCGGLGLWHTSGDSSECPPSAAAAAAAASSVSRHQSGQEDKRNNRGRGAIVKNILTSEPCHHTDAWQGWYTQTGLVKKWTTTAVYQITIKETGITHPYSEMWSSCFIIVVRDCLWVLH